MESLKNKVVLVTGASSGIGGFTARYLAQYKVRLALVARSADRLETVKKECEAKGCGAGNVLTIVADIVQQKELAGIVEKTVAKFGQLDVLINNAAAILFNDVENTPVEGFERCMGVNIRAPFFLSQAAMPHLKKTKGSIVNISSISAQNPMYDCAVYGISKAALEHFTRILAHEVASSMVRVNCVTVGVTFTDSQQIMSEIMGQKVSRETSKTGTLQPLGGSCSMEDIARAIFFLISDLSSAITGVSLPVDRGALLVQPCIPDGVSLKNMGDVNPKSMTESVAALKAMVSGMQQPPKK